MRRLATILLFVLVAAVALPADAAAGDDAGERRGPAVKGKKADRDWVSKLDAKELALLEARMPWDKLSAEKRQKIARTIVYLRSAPENKKRDFLRRARRWPTKRDHVSRHAGHMLANRGLSRAALRRLGPSFETELRKRDLSQHAFEMAFQMTFWRNALETRGSRSDRKQFWQKVQRQANDWRAQLAGAAVDPRALVDAMGTQALEAYPEAFEKSVSDPESLIRKTEHVEVKRGLRRLMQRSDRLSKEESLLLVRLVDRWAAKNRNNAPATGEQADALLESVLVNDLGVSQEVVDGIPPRSDPEARARYFQQHMRRAGFRMHRAGKQARGGMKNGRRPPREMPRPKGISDADWTLLMKARAEGWKNRKPGAWIRQKPDGVSDQGWQLLQEHLDAMLGGSRRKR